MLRAMMDAHFAHCRDRAEPVLMLFAAEPAIYGRFGYGLAARQVMLTIPRRAPLRAVEAHGLTVRVEHVDDATYGLVTRLHAAVDRPGWVTRSTESLQRSFLSETPQRKGDCETLRVLVVEREGEPVGYALFRRKFTWGPTGPSGSVRAVDVVAEEPAVALGRHGDRSVVRVCGKSGSPSVIGACCYGAQHPRELARVRGHPAGCH